MTTYPNVPPDPGVPTIPRDPNNPIASPQLLTGDTVTVTGYSNLPKWGLIDQNGKQPIRSDCIVDFEYKRDWAISDYQIQNGSFQSYDKVQLPFDARMTFAMGGSEDDRANFLTQIEDVVESLNMYTAVTPEATYPNCNAAHWDYRRTSSNGVGLIQAHIYFLEVRQISAEQFTNSNTSPASQANTQDPGAAGEVNDGTVQAQPTTPAQQSLLTQGLSSLNDVSNAVNSVVDQATIAASQIIPIQATAAQTLAVTLNNQACQLQLYQKRSGFYANLSVNNNLVIGGVLCENMNRLVRSKYLGFQGDLAFMDQAGSSNPNFSQLGSRFALAYLPNVV